MGAGRAATRRRVLVGGHRSPHRPRRHRVRASGARRGARAGARVADLGDGGAAAARVGGGVRDTAGGGRRGEPRDVGRVPGRRSTGKPTSGGGRAWRGCSRRWRRSGPAARWVWRGRRSTPAPRSATVSRAERGRGSGRSGDRCSSPAPRRVGAIFKAPATGAVFALESPYQDDLARRMLLPALVGAATGYLILVSFDGTTPLLTVHGSPPFSGIDLAGAVAIGVLAGIGARLFAALVRVAKRVAARGPALPRIVVGGASLGGLFLAGRALTGRDLVLGPGYDAVRWSITNHPEFVVLVAVLALRCLATAATVGAGGAGGCSSRSWSPARCSARPSRPSPAGRPACSRSSGWRRSSGPATGCRSPRWCSSPRRRAAPGSSSGVVGRGCR